MNAPPACYVEETTGAKAVKTVGNIVFPMNNGGSYGDNHCLDDGKWQAGLGGS